METILTGLIIFLITNVDDILFLFVFYNSKKFSDHEILFGQLLGFGGIILISLVCSFLGHSFNSSVMGLLGLIPIIKGVSDLIKFHAGRPLLIIHSVATATRPGNVVSIASVVMANGGNNVVIYIPLLITYSPGSQCIVVLVLIALTTIMCTGVKYLSGKLERVMHVLRFSSIISPLVFICMGLYILLIQGTFNYVLSLVPAIHLIFT